MGMTPGDIKDNGCENGSDRTCDPLINLNLIEIGIDHPTDIKVGQHQKYEPKWIQKPDPPFYVDR